MHLQPFSSLYSRRTSPPRTHRNRNELVPQSQLRKDAGMFAACSLAEGADAAEDTVLLSLPIGEPLLVFLQNRGRDFRPKAGIVQLFLHLRDFRLDLFQFFQKTSLFGSNVNQ